MIRLFGKSNTVNCISRRRSRSNRPSVEPLENKALLSVIGQDADVTGQCGVSATLLSSNIPSITQLTPSDIAPISVSSNNTATGVGPMGSSENASYATSLTTTFSSPNAASIQSGTVSMSGSIDTMPYTLASFNNHYSLSIEADANGVFTINYNVTAEPYNLGLITIPSASLTITDANTVIAGQTDLYVDSTKSGSYSFPVTKGYVYSILATNEYAIAGSSSTTEHHDASVDFSWDFTSTASATTTTTVVTSSANPSVVGQPVTFKATVSPTTASQSAPTGTITFMDGSTVLGHGALNSSGTATFTTSTLAVGNHSISAVYGGDTNFTTSTSSPVTQVVNTASNRPPTGSFTAYRPITEAIDFNSYPISRSVEATSGVGIRIDGQPSSSRGEPDDDLIRVDIRVASPTPPAGMQYELESTNDDLNVWGDRTEKTSILDSTAAPISFSSSTKTVWVEWSNPYRGSSDLELVAKNVSTGQTTTLDKLSFHTFTSDVILFAGEQFGSAPPNPGGMLDIATSLYQDGYDVHLYAPGLDIANLSVGLGEAFQEVENAVDLRGVTQIAIIGHSHGGGATYMLANMITSAIRSRKLTSTFGNVTIPFTGYVDAIENASVTDRKSEAAIPPGAKYLLNIYQTNTQLISFLVHGIMIHGAENHNVTAKGVNHNNIVLIPAVQTMLTKGVLQRVHR